MIEPGHPFQGCQFHGFLRLPRTARMNQFSLVQAINGFCQGIIVAIHFASYRRLNTCPGQTLAIVDRNVLRIAVAARGQGIVAFCRTRARPFPYIAPRNVRSVGVSHPLHQIPTQGKRKFDAFSPSRFY